MYPMWRSAELEIQPKSQFCALFLRSCSQPYQILIEGVLGCLGECLFLEHAISVTQMLWSSWANRRTCWRWSSYGAQVFLQQQMKLLVLAALLKFLVCLVVSVSSSGVETMLGLRKKIFFSCSIYRTFSSKLQSFLLKIVCAQRVGWPHF